jgi:ATP-dependent exoDNAse (exonuclease V) beta subunit
LVSLTEKGTPTRLQHYYEEESKKTLIDKLNMLYVAHTRARNELHIITEKADTSRGNYSKFLAEFLNNYDLQVTSYELSVTNYQLQSSHHHIVSSSHHHIPKSSHHLINILPSALQQERGIYIHNFLSSLVVFPQNEKEIELTVQKVEEIYRENLIGILKKILNDNSLKPYFEPNIKGLNETSILLPNGNLLRPDRVVFLEDKVVVIDYKTGEPHASHKEQIDRYCDVIREMGYKDVEGRILFFN